MVYQIVLVIFLLLVLASILFGDLESWDRNYREAKEYLKDQGFKTGRYESVLIEGETVTLSPRTDEETTPESLEKFHIWKFGKEISVYVHISGNLAFMRTNNEDMASILVYEK